jgi:hypothetical protein
VQIRRVLLLFALVLGLSALVASIAPPPETRDEPSEEAPPADEPVSPPGPVTRAAPVSFEAGRADRPPRTTAVRVGSSFSLEVSVPGPGDVVIDGLGLRQPADALSPARFELLAQPPGRYDVAFLPVSGGRRTVGRLHFAEPATVTPRRRDR